MKDYAILPNVLMCTIDGTQYHSSNSVSCHCCLTKEHKSGELTYSHSVLQGAIMHPDKKQVIPLCPKSLNIKMAPRNKIVSSMRANASLITYGQRIQGRSL